MKWPLLPQAGILADRRARTRKVAGRFIACVRGTIEQHTACEAFDYRGASEGTIPLMSHVTVEKTDVLDLVQALPDDIDIEDLIYRLYLREKLATAEADIAAGRTVSVAEARSQAASWRK